MLQGYFERGFESTETEVARLTKLLSHAPRSYEDFATRTAAMWKVLVDFSGSSKIYQPKIERDLGSFRAQDRLVNLCGAGSGVGWMGPLVAGTGEKCGHREESEGGEHEDAALRPGRAAGEQRPPDGVGGEQVVLDHVAAVADTVEEGLGPVPRGVGADRPPE